MVTFTGQVQQAVHRFQKSHACLDNRGFLNSDSKRLLGGLAAGAQLIPAIEPSLQKGSVKPHPAFVTN